MILYTMAVSALLLVGARDYQARLPSGETACVRPDVDHHRTGEDICRDYAGAAFRGWLPGIPAGTIVRCSPRPNCMPAREDCIRGFNCR